VMTCEEARDETPKHPNKELRAAAQHCRENDDLGSVLCMQPTDPARKPHPLAGTGGAHTVCRSCFVRKRVGSATKNASWTDAAWFSTVDTRCGPPPQLSKDRVPS
jgi:hypothetical protein